MSKMSKTDINARLRRLHQFPEVYLTRREKEVLSLLSQGMTGYQAAETLFISYRTINFHVASILQKTKAQNVTAAVVVALHLGLIAHPGSIVLRQGAYQEGVTPR